MSKITILIFLFLCLFPLRPLSLSSSILNPCFPCSLIVLFSSILFFQSLYLFLFPIPSLFSNPHISLILFPIPPLFSSPHLFFILSYLYSPLSPLPYLSISSLSYFSSLSLHLSYLFFRFIFPVFFPFLLRALPLPFLPSTTPVPTLRQPFVVRHEVNSLMSLRYGTVLLFNYHFYFLSCIFPLFLLVLLSYQHFPFLFLLIVPFLSLYSIVFLFLR